MKKIKIASLIILVGCMSSCSFLDALNNAINNELASNSYLISRERSKEEYLNNGFLESESNLLNSYFGYVVNYLANDSYDLLDYANDVSVYYYDMQINDFNYYIDSLKETYLFYKIESNCYGYSSNIYKTDNSYIETYFIEDKNMICLNVYEKSLYDFKRENKTSEGYVLSNSYKNLPNSSDSLMKIDLSKNYIVANGSNDLGSYKESCKTTGSPNVLVIPVEFKDVKASDKNYTIDAIKNAFYSKNTTKASLAFYSVYDYFYESSFGKLDLNIEVLDEWFMPEHESNYYREASFNVSNHVLNNGEQIIMNEALAYLDNKGYDLSKYDNDKNKRIDAIIMINTLDIVSPTDRNDSFDWAFRYYNYYLEDKVNYYSYDGVAANDYIWANYQFLYLDDNNSYKSTTPNNPYTYVHEFSHILGAEDYYDYYNSRKKDGPLKGYDVMDETATDHNPYTKMTFGWIDNANLVLKTGKYKLDSIENNNACYLVGSDFDLALGAYQEYYLICYYGKENINKDYSMFLEPSVVIYHVDASLLKYSSSYLGLVNNNDSYASGGSKNDLISLTGVYQLSKIALRLINNIKLTTNNGERIPFTLNFEYGTSGLYLVVK